MTGLTQRLAIGRVQLSPTPEYGFNVVYFQPARPPHFWQRQPSRSRIARRNRGQPLGNRRPLLLDKGRVSAAFRRGQRLPALALSNGQYRRHDSIIPSITTTLR